MRLILVRHGETDWNAQHRYQGWSDPPLNEVGLRQAAALAARLAGEQVGAFYASDLQRATQTAQIVAEGHGQPVATDPRLREISFGDWEGATFDEIRARWPGEADAWLDDSLRVAAPGGETLAQVAGRVQDALDDIAEKHAAQTVLLVAHGGTLRVLLCLALDLDVRAHWRFRLDAGSVSELGVYGGKATLVKLNVTECGDGRWEN